MLRNEGYRTENDGQKQAGKQESLYSECDRASVTEGMNCSG